MSRPFPPARVRPTPPPLPSRPAAAPPSPRPWNWTAPLLVVLIGLVAAALVLEIALLRSLGARTDPVTAAARPEPPPPPPASAAPAAATQPPALAPTPAPAPAPAPEPKPKEAASAEKKFPEGERVFHEAHLEALGSLTGVHLYQTHLNIGLLADGAESDVYAPDEAKKLLETVTSLMDAVEKQVSQVPEATLTADDRKALEKVRKLTALLRTQATELQAYWDGGEKEHADKFHKAREQTWEGVKELLDLEE